MIAHAFWVYLGVVGLITVTPGPDTAVVVRNAMRYGPAAGIRTGIGSALGLLIWALAATASIAMLLAASAWAFTALKCCGALYLGYLGSRMVWSAWKRPSEGDAVSPVEARSAVPARGLLAQGLVTNLLNPKAGAFFTAVFPQFVSAHGAAAILQGVVLALIAATASLVGQCAYAVAAYRVSQVIARRRFEKIVDSTVGVVLIGLGAKLALTQNP